MNDYVVTNVESRIRKAKKIIAILEDFVYPLRDKNILDTGCGSGVISHELAKYGNKVFANDVTSKHFHINIHDASDPIFLLSDAQKLPYKDKSFDVVVCNHILEHVKDKYAVILEIKRVLKEGGYAYISQDNKLWPIEPHYKLPFLSYLPRILANKYINVFNGGGTYDNISLPTYWELNNLITSQNFKEVVNVTPSIIKNSKDYYAEEVVPGILKKAIKFVPDQVFKCTICFLPGWIYVTKR